MTAYLVPHSHDAGRLADAVADALAGWPAPAGAGRPTHVLIAAGEPWATVFYGSGATAEHDLAGTGIPEHMAEEFYENEHQAQLRRHPVPPAQSCLYTVAAGTIDTAADPDLLLRAAGLS